MNIIKELYYGNLCPNENKMEAEHNRRYFEALDLLDKNEELLNKTLSKKKQKSLQQIIEAGHQMEEIIGHETFRDGFCLGAVLMLEITQHQHKR